MNFSRKVLASVALTAALTAGVAGPASAGIEDLIGTPPAADERCKVPPLLFQVAAVVDPDSLEGCGFFEDPNFHENRKQAGLYNPNGPFSILFG
ncbi:MAG: hypothetical protein H0U29_03780 [Acidimicrobiia bacterium]|jgi:hypothetical protein|nr:hypothetical protein [Acidimicrobiia bacterium]